MKFTFDTDVVKEQLTENLTIMKGMVENAVPESIKTKGEMSEYERIQTELEYIKFLTDWNIGRAEEGKPIYVPKKLSRSAQRILNDAMNRLKEATP